MIASAKQLLENGWIEGRRAPDDPTSRPFEPITEHDLINEVLRPLRMIAETQPDAIAVDDGFRRLTCAQLWRAVQSLAASIQAATPPDAVVLALARSDVFFPVMLLGAHLAGRPFVIQDLASPVERQSVIFEEAAASAVLVPEGGNVEAPYVPSTVPRISVALAPQGAVTPIRRQADPSERFTIFFTSGSTGRAKGIAVSAVAKLKNFCIQINHLQIDKGDVVLCLAPPGTMSMIDVLMSLLTGARLRLLDLRTSSIPELFRVLREERITMLCHAPSVLRNIMQAAGDEPVFKNLRILRPFGEPVSRTDLALFRSKLSARCEISFVFGSSEALQLLQWYVRDDAVTGPGVPLGYLAEGRRIAVLDEEGRAVPRGEAGELVISDDLVALGDWRNGAVDASRFPTDPTTGKRVYASGDLVRMRPDGLFEFAGRRDRMVKVHGLRTDLGEVEAALKSIPGVDDAVVVAQEREAAHTRLVAFIVVTAGHAIVDAEIRRRVAAEAAPHMVPAVIHRIAEIPRLHNGKPDLVGLAAIARRPRK